MTAEEWDTHWHRIYNQWRNDGVSPDKAYAGVDRETVEQFGPRPTETA